MTLAGTAAAHRAYLKHAAVGDRSARASTLLLLVDTLAAIGFAGGLAGAVAAIASGGAIAGWLVLAFAAGIARGAVSWLGARVAARGARGVKRRLRTRIAAAVLDRPTDCHRTGGELVQAAIDEVEAIDGHIARFLPARRAAAVAPLLIAVATAIASPVAAAILVATLLPFVFALALAGGAAAEQSRRQFAALARLSGLFADRVRALPVLLAFGAAEREADRLGEAARDVADLTLRVLRVAFLSSGTLEFFSALSVALVAVYCGFNLLGLLPLPVPEKLDLGRAFFVLALAPEFYAPMRRLAAAYHDKQAAETAAGRLAAIEAERTPSHRVAIADKAPEVRFEEVTVRYPGADRDAVHRLNLTVRAGETVALLGPSGSGKTSILRLLLGLTPIAAGNIRVDGEALPPGGSIATRAAWLGQTTLLTPGSIADNIALAEPSATRSAIERVAEQAGLTAMLARRSDGLDTRIDERGSGLSGGERRRIGLARVLLKSAPVLLLDEPTAHLDPAAETGMIAAIERAARGRTVIVATHSAALAAIADRTIVLGSEA